MKRFSVSCAMFALPVVALATGVQLTNPAHAAGQQTEAASASAPTEAQISPEPATDTAEPDAHEVECVAKVIVHEAGNQLHRGQVAVAQVIRTRMKRAGTDACETILQPGQFFNVNRYAPDRSSEVWHKAVAIATDTLKGEGAEVVPGALFFHTATHPMHGRIQVAQIDDHIFYR